MGAKQRRIVVWAKKGPSEFRRVSSPAEHVCCVARRASESVSAEVRFRSQENEAMDIGGGHVLSAELVPYTRVVWTVA